MIHSSSEHHSQRARRKSSTIRHRHKVRDVSTTTRMRMRYFEFKIELSDFCERIVHSIQRALPYKTGILKAKENKSSSNVNRRKSFSKNIKNRRRGYHSDRGAKVVRRTVSQRSTSLVQTNCYRHHNDDDQSSLNSQKSTARQRKQRSSLTKAKKSKSVEENVNSTSGKVQRKSLGLGDNTTSCGSAKSSEHSVDKNRPSKTSKDAINPHVQEGQETIVVDEEVQKNDVTCKEDVEETVKTQANVDNNPPNGTNLVGPQNYSAFPWTKLKTEQIISDTAHKKYWKRCAQQVVSLLKPRRRDALPPKLAKIGFGIAAPSGKERISKNEFDPSPDAPSLIPSLFRPFFHRHRNDNALQNTFLASTSPYTNIMSGSIGVSPEIRKTPMTAINRQVGYSNPKFSSLIPQIRKTAADRNDIMSTLPSYVNNSSYQSDLVSNSMRERCNRIISRTDEDYGIISSTNHEMPNKMTFSAATTQQQRPVPPLYNSLSPALTGENLNPTSEWMVPLTTTIDVAIPIPGKRGLPRPSYEPKSDFTAKYAHLLWHEI